MLTCASIVRRSFY